MKSTFFHLAITALATVVWPEASAAPRRTENVILVTTDGLRWQEVFQGAEEALMNKTNGGVTHVEMLRAKFWRETPEDRRRALLPFVWGVMAKQGQLFGHTNKGSIARVTNGKNFSYPGYSELLAGFGDSRIDSNAKKPNPNVTVLEWLHGMPRYRNQVAAFGSWDVFPFIINQERSGVLVNAGNEALTHRRLTEREVWLNQVMGETLPPWDGVRMDSLTFAAAMEHLTARRPRVLYLALDETDDWAHDGRYDRYLQSAHRVDHYLGKLWETLQNMSPYRGKTTVLVTTDHGRGDAPVEWKNHGEKTAGSEYIWLAVMGPDTPALGERTQTDPITQSQVAATLAQFLGEDYCRAFPLAARPIPGVATFSR